MDRYVYDCYNNTYESSTFTYFLCCCSSFSHYYYYCGTIFKFHDCLLPLTHLSKNKKKKRNLYSVLTFLYTYVFSFNQM